MTKVIYFFVLFDTYLQVWGEGGGAFFPNTPDLHGLGVGKVWSPSAGGKIELQSEASFQIDFQVKWSKEPFRWTGLFEIAF